MSKTTAIKGKDLSVFVRFGGVSLKKQKGYSASPETYHAPPAPRGFYAMPKVAQEFFLLGSLEKFQPSTVPKRSEYPGDDATKEELDKWENYDWDAFQKRKDNSMSAMRKEFKKSDGNIWHHLEEYTTNVEIMERHGSWVKTSISAWMKAFSKMSLEHRYGNRSSGFDFSVKSINDARGILGIYSKDHCEVFFDEKI